MILRLLLLTAAATGAVAGTGCAVHTAADGAVGMANPASAFCVHEKRGRIEISTDEAGNQVGLCHLPDGTVVEEWELFRRERGAQG